MYAYIIHILIYTYIHTNVYIYIYTYISEGGPVLEPLGGPDLDSAPTFFFFFITLGLELSDTKVYEP